MASGADTHTYRRANQSNFKKPGVHGQRPRVPGLKRRIRIESEKVCTQVIDQKVWLKMELKDYYVTKDYYRIKINSKIRICYPYSDCSGL